MRAGKLGDAGLEGAAVWMRGGRHDGRLPPGDGKRKWEKARQGRWLDDGRIYDNWGFNGCDGIIRADMEPKEQFWRVKAVYRGSAARDR